MRMNCTENWAYALKKALKLGMIIMLSLNIVRAVEKIAKFCRLIIFSEGCFGLRHIRVRYDASFSTKTLT